MTKENLIIVRDCELKIADAWKQLISRLNCFIRRDVRCLVRWLLVATAAAMIEYSALSGQEVEARRSIYCICACNIVLNQRMEIKESAQPQMKEAAEVAGTYSSWVFERSGIDVRVEWLTGHGIRCVRQNTAQKDLACNRSDNRFGA